MLQAYVQHLAKDYYVADPDDLNALLKELSEARARRQKGSDGAGAGSFKFKASGSPGGGSFKRTLSKRGGVKRGSSTSKLQVQLRRASSGVSALFKSGGP